MKMNWAQMPYTQNTVHVDETNVSDNGKKDDKIDTVLVEMPAPLYSLRLENVTEQRRNMLEKSTKPNPTEAKGLGFKIIIIIRGLTLGYFCTLHNKIIQM